MLDLETSTKVLFKDITESLIFNDISITTMESCTAGLLASFIANCPGASKIFSGASITYSNQAKIDAGVKEETINKYGVYSAETSIEMAVACQNKYHTNIGIGVTGIIDRDDPNNKSKSHAVYYSISYKFDPELTESKEDYLYNYVVIIPDSITDRFDRKLYVLNNIGVHLSDILYEMN